VRQGGQAKDLKALAKPAPSVSKSGFDRRACAQVVKAWEKFCQIPPDRMGQGRVVLLKERGAKSRVVTALEVNTVMRGHFIRDAFWPLLTADPRMDLEKVSFDPIARYPDGSVVAHGLDRPFVCYGYGTV